MERARRKPKDRLDCARPAGEIGAPEGLQVQIEGGHLGRVDEGHVWLERLLQCQPGLAIASFVEYLAKFCEREFITAYATGLRNAGLPEK